MKTKTKAARLLIFTALAVSLITAGKNAEAKKIKVNLGKVGISAYCMETNDPPGTRATCTGKTARGHHTIAVDMYNPIVNKGATVMIEGDDTLYHVEDVGNLNHYGREFDIFMESYSEMEHWGVKYRNVYLIREETDAEKKERIAEKEKKKEEKRRKLTMHASKEATTGNVLVMPGTKKKELPDEIFSYIGKHMHRISEIDAMLGHGPAENKTGQPVIRVAGHTYGTK